MKIHPKRLTAASLAIAMLHLVPTVMLGADRDASRIQDTRTTVRSDGSDGRSMSGKLRMAPEDKDDRALRKIEGQKVRGLGGNDLGEVKDLLIEPESGRVAYAVVATGGMLGMGETLRMVPFASLRRTADRDAFLIEMTETQWKEMPVIERKAYNDGNFSVGAANQRAVGQNRPEVATVRDGRTETRPAVVAADRGVAREARADRDDRDDRADRERRARAVAATDRTTSTEAGRRVEAGNLDRVIRSSTLRGKEIRAGDQKIGKIESVVLDWETGAATAVLDLDRSFTGTNRKFMIPVSELALRNEDQDVIVTNLTRENFQQIVRGETVATDTRLTPTGRVDLNDRATTVTSERARVSPDAEVSPVLQSAIRSARQNIGNFPSLKATEVEVLAYNGKMLLRGFAESEEIKDRVEKAAQEGAPGIPFESHVVVRPAKR